MKDASSAPSIAVRCIVGVLDVILLVGLVAWVAENSIIQICYLAAAFVLALALVLSVAAWRHGLRWFFSLARLRFYAWLAAGVISVIVLFYAEESWRGKRAWAALQREVTARGESLELSSVVPPPVPDDQNFALAPGVGRLLGFAEPGSGESRESAPSGVFYHGTRDKWPSASWELQQATDLAAWQTFFRQHPITPLAPTNDKLSWLAFPVAPEPQAPAADVLLALSRYDSALAVLRAASQRPKVRYPLDYEEGIFALVSPPHEPHLEILYSAAHVLSLRAVAELTQDQSEAALQDTLLALRLADSLRQEPYDQLHRSRAAMLRLCLQPVWEGLAGHRWNEAQLLTLQQHFADMDLLLEYRVWARGETLMLMNLADQFHAFLEGRGSPLGNRLTSADDSDRYWVWLFRAVYPVGWLYQDKVWIYRAYEQRADISKAMDPDSRRHWGNEILRATDPALLIMVVPKVREVFDESARGSLYLQTACQETMVACALERCRMAQGQYPAALDGLVPTWLKQVPGDLLATNAAPLKYRREEAGGFALYSIGLNGVDDQGKPGSVEKDWRGVQRDSPRLDDGDWIWRQPSR